MARPDGPPEILAAVKHLRKRQFSVRYRAHVQADATEASTPFDVI
jgi:hypothetical protein